MVAQTVSLLFSKYISSESHQEEMSSTNSCWYHKMLLYALNFQHCSHEILIKKAHGYIILDIILDIGRKIPLNMCRAKATHT